MMPITVRRAWVVVKSAPLRETPYPDGKQIDRLYFGQVLIKGNKPNQNGYMFVKYLRKTNPQEKYTVGWISIQALTNSRIYDMAGLYYQNQEKIILPVYGDNRLKVKIGRILPGETVSVKAVVGSRCLTNKGWTAFGFLTKKRYIADQEAIDTVLANALAWAVRDYRTLVRNIQKHKYNSPVAYAGMVEKLEDIAVFFVDKGNVLNCDSIPGRERLDDLNEELGIDYDWLLAHIDKADAWRKKYSKKDDTARRYPKSTWTAQKY